MKRNLRIRRDKARKSYFSTRADSALNHRGTNLDQTRRMIRTVLLGVVLTLLVPTVFAITAVHGKIKKLDSAAKTVVVKAADGTEHTFHFASSTVVHGTEKTAVGATDVFQGLKDGSDVVVHYTTKGSEKTAEEIDYVGKDGMKTAEGTVTRIDRSGKTLSLKTPKGAEETFRLSDHAAEDAGKDIEKAGEKSGKVTVYYTEEAGHKIAHFFKKTL